MQRSNNMTWQDFNLNTVFYEESTFINNWDADKKKEEEELIRAQVVLFLLH